jgi:hypothetical protein
MLSYSAFSRLYWFEDRGPACALLVFVDDATGRLLPLRFVPSEGAFASMAATRTYIETHGKPVAFSSDRHGIFRVDHPDAAGGDGMTRSGRALAIADHRHHPRQQPAGEGPGGAEGRPARARLSAAPR